MAKITITARIVHALLQMGCKEVESNIGKYRTFQKQEAGLADFYLVGHAGALRKGRCASKSYSISHMVPAFLAKYPMPEGAK